MRALTCGLDPWVEVPAPELLLVMGLRSSYRCGVSQR